MVRLPTLPETVSQALKVRPASQMLIPSDVELDCELSYTTMFNWNVYKLSPEREENMLVLSRNGSSQLLIRGRMLPVGSYLVRLTVSMRGTKVFGVSEGYIRVVRSPLIALISGGTKVERGFNKTLEFDASFSRDPDAVLPYTGKFTVFFQNQKYGLELKRSKTWSENMNNDMKMLLNKNW